MIKSQEDYKIENSQIQPPPINRQVFCNRTLNFRSLRAIGYDMDYTLIHYCVEEWERRAYQSLKEYFLERGWPVQSLEFDPHLVCRGLIIDVEKGNLLKVNRFGFVKKAMHGTRFLEFPVQRDFYARTVVDLAEKRWVFLNTLFSLSEGCMYAQLVELLDQRKIPEVLGYADLYERVRDVLDAAHLEGKLKSEIIDDPERFVILDPDIPLTLLDQYDAGKKIVLITNAEWRYTSAMMTYSFNRFLPAGKVWSDLFDLVIVEAKKPQFFMGTQPIFEVVTPDGLLKPVVGKLQRGKAYLGGSARQVENYFGYSGDEILYVGDHVFSDVHVTKNILRWRTALILRELENEIESVRGFQDKSIKFKKLMCLKEKVEFQLCQFKIKLQRKKYNSDLSEEDEEKNLNNKILEMKKIVEDLDRELTSYAQISDSLNNPHWGLLFRAGQDKSYLAYQLERYADVYTSRVSNFLFETPFSYLRSLRGNLPHDGKVLGE